MEAMSSTGRRPRIAINGELDHDQGPTVTLATRYAEAVRRAGGIPLVLPPLVAPRFAEELLASVDGLLLSGGGDFDTESLGLGPTHPAARPVAPEKQAFDLSLARAAVRHGVPTLGVCYGMQLLALADGGTLYQHLPEDLPAAREHRGGARHAVRPVPGTKLARLLGVAEVDVVSRHHQALRTSGDGWTVSARDDQGLIEGVEREDHPFALGVQWHPELALDTEGEEQQLALFRALVEAASRSREIAEVTT